MRLAGKVAIVTGAGSGIGRAIAVGYAREGARVVAVDRRPDAAEQTAADAPDAIVALAADVTRSEDVASMVAETVRRFGRLDVLVNNAAIQLHGRDGRCHEVDEVVWEETLAVNLRGPFLCAKFALPELVKSRGTIVNIASPTAFGNKGAGYTAYATSKGGIVTLTRVLAADYAADGVRVNAIVPGATETPLITEILADERIRGRLTANTPLRRLGQPDDLVGIAIFLASEESRFATGAHFFVDGGSTMH